jgi:voltage-gated potassium channel
MLLRITLTVAVMLAAYGLVPVKGPGEQADLPWLLLALVIFGIVVAVQIPLIIRSKHPILRAVEALALTVSLFLLSFSRIYLSNSVTDPTTFTQPLDNATALYFTVTVFATVGFGDIVATSGPARVIVSVQMLLDLAILGFAVRITFGVARSMFRRDDEGT